MTSLRHALAALLAATLTLFGVTPATAADVDAPASCPPVATPLSSERFEAGLARGAATTAFSGAWSRTDAPRTSTERIHAARVEWMFPGPRTVAALGASDVLALELDVLDNDVQARLAAGARAAPGRTRSPPPLQQRIDRRMIAECIDPPPWHAFAPEFQIASLVGAGGTPRGPRSGVRDRPRAGTGRARVGKPIVSLETPEAQVAALRLPSRAETIELVE